MSGNLILHCGSPVFKQPTGAVFKIVGVKMSTICWTLQWSLLTVVPGSLCHAPLSLKTTRYQQGVNDSRARHHDKHKHFRSLAGRMSLLGKR